MHIHISRISMICATLIVVSACAQTTSDPCATANRPVSFGTLLSSSVSGAYGGCIAVLREDLAVARMRARVLENEAQTLRAEEARLSGERRAAAARLAELNERQAAAVASLTEATAEREVEQARLEALLAEERRLSDDVSALNARGAGATENERRVLIERQNRLQSQIRALLG